MKSIDSFKCLDQLEVKGKTYHFFNLKKAQQNGLEGIQKLPNSQKVLLENLLRHENGVSVREEQIKAFSDWAKNGKNPVEISFHPARVLMQDFTGVPGVVDLAAMRDAMVAKGNDAQKINPLRPVDLVIDHSVMVDFFGNDQAFQKNVDFEFKRNLERYELLKWAQLSFRNFRVVPPGTGICHQVNLEYLAKSIWHEEDAAGKNWAFPDTCVGTDSHTTMINGLSVLGWGVGGIEAEAAMLAQPISMVLPEVVGFKLTGKLKEGVTATDLVLTVVEMLRKKGVVGKFVEFYGNGLNELMLADRATIANMAPEYGATCGFFPIDQETCRYMELTGRPTEDIELVAKYAQEQGMWRNEDEMVFTSTLELDLGTVKASLAGPKRPQDRIELSQVKNSFHASLKEAFGKAKIDQANVKAPSEEYTIEDGSVVIAAITSCTNTSNPSVMIGAGLVAQKAAEKGLQVKPWVKTSLAPGSQVVSEYLERSGLQKSLDQLGFNLVGYGCTTCIGNSGPLGLEISRAIQEKNLVAASVLSGNRNFEGRISQDVKANYLASPPLVVAYALAGTVNIDIENDSLGNDQNGNPVYLKDLWPSNDEIASVVGKCVNKELFQQKYAEVFKGPEQWQQIAAEKTSTFAWNKSSTYVQKPPFFEIPRNDQLTQIEGMKMLAMVGDSVTTDHISPAGSIKLESPAGQYLVNKGVEEAYFNSYGSRRGNHEVMMRGTFANVRFRNEILPGTEGGVAKDPKSGKPTSIYDAAMEYQKTDTPLIVVAGKEYGTGSSRDWAAKGTRLLGVVTVLAESFERIHRSNLIGMGVLPIEFKEGESRKSLGLTGDETLSIYGLDQIKPGCELTVKIEGSGNPKEIKVKSRIDTEDELAYYHAGGILKYVMENL